MHFWLVQGLDATQEELDYVDLADHSLPPRHTEITKLLQR